MNVQTASPQAPAPGDAAARHDGRDWRDFQPGIQVHVLRTCQETGTFVALYKVAAGTTAAAHIHYGAAESYMISGRIEAASGKVLLPGDHSFEPNGAHHDATYFPEDTILFFINYGPIMYLDEDGNCDTMVDFAYMRDIQARG
jgi:anti-sigma factor ChrR (cupin superfamily)